MCTNNINIDVIRKKLYRDGMQYQLLNMNLLDDSQYSFSL